MDGPLKVVYFRGGRGRLNRRNFEESICCVSLRVIISDKCNASALEKFNYESQRSRHDGYLLCSVLYIR